MLHSVEVKIFQAEKLDNQYRIAWGLMVQAWEITSHS